LIIRTEVENDTLLLVQKDDQNHLLEKMFLLELKQEKVKNGLQNLLYLEEQKINK
jgi:hypothetical protein